MIKNQVRLTQFSDLITRYTVDFIGREWLEKQLEALLEKSDIRFVVLIGEPGIGKTAFMANLAAKHPGWPRYFLRRDSRELLRSGDAKTFLLTIGGQLASLYPQLFRPENLNVTVRQRIESLEQGGSAIGIRIDELKVSPFHNVALYVEQEIRRVKGEVTGLEIGRLVGDARLLDLADLESLALLTPAGMLRGIDPSGRIVILLDALDELRYNPAEQDILQMLRGLTELPENIRFIISTRPEAFLQPLLDRRDCCHLKLDKQLQSNLEDDLRAYAQVAFTDFDGESSLRQLGLDPTTYIQKLLSKANRNFLFMRSVVTEIREVLKYPAQKEKLEALLRIEQLPTDLAQLYNYFLSNIVDLVKQHGFGESAWRTHVKPLLSILAVAREPLSNDQLAAFTGLKKEDVRDLLHELRQFVVSVEGKRTFQLYHASFAEHIFDEENNPDYWVESPWAHERIINRYLQIWGRMDRRLPELKNPDRRDIDEGYGLRHLATHLSAGNWNSELNRLLALEWLLDGRHTNVWFTVKDAAGDIEGYLADVGLAWKYAQEDNCSDDGKRSVCVTLNCRYALLTASIHSLSRNIPPVLFPIFLRGGRLSPTEALVHARSIPDSKLQAEALTELVPHLPDTLLMEAVELLRANANSDQRALGLVKASVRVSEPQKTRIQEEAMEAVQATGWRKGELLGEMASFLSEPQLQKALTIAREIGNIQNRQEALTSLFPQLPDSLKADVALERLTLARQVKNVREKLYLMVKVIPDLQEPTKSQTVLEAIDLAYQHKTAFGFTEVARHLNGAMKNRCLESALAEAYKAYGGHNLVSSLCDVAEQFSGPRKEQALKNALDIARRIDSGNRSTSDSVPAARAKALGAVAALLSEPHKTEILREALDMAREIPDWGFRNTEICNVMYILGPHLPQQLLQEAADISETIRKLKLRIEAWAYLLPNMPEKQKYTLVRKALNVIRTMTDEINRPKALGRIAKHLSEDLLEEAFIVAQSINDQSAVSFAMAKLVQYAPSSEKGALIEHTHDIIRSIGAEDAEGAVETLIQLVSSIKESDRIPLLDDILHAARTFTGFLADYHRSEIIVRLVDLAPKSFITSLLSEAHKIPGHNQVMPILRIVDQLPKKSRPTTLRRTLEVARNDPVFRTEDSTEKLAVKLAENGCFEEALQTVAVIKGTYGFDDEHKTRALLGLLEYLPKNYLKKAIELVLSFETPLVKAEALVEFIPYIGLDVHPKIISHVSQILRTVSAGSLLGRLDVLVKLARYVSDSFVADVRDLVDSLLTEIREVDDYYTRVCGLLRLATIVDESDRLPMVVEAWKAAQMIENIKARAHAIVELLAQLPESIRSKAFGHVLDDVPKLQEHSDRSEILLIMFREVRDSDDVAITHRIFDLLEELESSHLSFPLEGIIDAVHSWEGTQYLHRVKKLAKTIQNPHERAKVFMHLISALPINESRDIVASYLEAAQQIDHWKGRQSLLSELSEQLIKFEPRILFSPWCDAMMKLTSHTREDLLGDLAALAPVIWVLGGEHACLETYNAISDVARWWP